jgi:hypothetical protein
MKLERKLKQICNIISNFCSVNLLAENSRVKQIGNKM